jgi:hypothetical protein
LNILLLLVAVEHYLERVAVVLVLAVIEAAHHLH